jgi:hypothetical protein
VLPDVMSDITRKITPRRRARTYPRTVKRARHNSYPVTKSNERNTRHAEPPNINIRGLTLQAA